MPLDHEMEDIPELREIASRPRSGFKASNASGGGSGKQEKLNTNWVVWVEPVYNGRVLTAIFLP